MESEKKHFILVHGACHGAWCWYKVSTLLQSAGHRVTALDLAACGVNPKHIDQLQSFTDYSDPLLQVMAVIPESEKVILVGHSFGGLSLALAMEKFPEKISVAVFASAAMPRARAPMSVIFEEFLKEIGPDFFMDTKFTTENSQDNGVIVNFGPNYLSKRLYQKSPLEDITLAMMLVRPVNQFTNDKIMKENFLTEGNYSSVSRVYIVSEADDSWSPEFQRSMAEKNPGTEIREIDGADHMLMLSKPRELYNHLMEIAVKFE